MKFWTCQVTTFCSAIIYINVHRLEMIKLFKIKYTYHCKAVEIKSDIVIKQKLNFG